MKQYMNEPIAYERTDEDIIKEYDCCRNKKKVARIWGVSTKEVNEALRKQIKVKYNV